MNTLLNRYQSANILEKKRTRAGVSSCSPVSGMGRPRPRMEATMGVSTGWGHTVHSRTPCPANFGAIDRVKCTSPAYMHMTEFCTID